MEDTTSNPETSSDPVCLNSPDHKAIVLPVSWPARRKAHLTLLYLGDANKPEFTLNKEHIKSLLDMQQNYWPNFIRLQPMNYDMFGYGKIPVLRVDSGILRNLREALVDTFAFMGIHSASEYSDWNPHISLKGDDGLFPAGQVLEAGRPFVWWDDDDLPA
jgi:hypothetical protein